MTDAPHNIEVEQALLGAILVNPEAVERVSFLRPEEFFDPFHARIFVAMRDLRGRGAAISPATLDPFIADQKIGELTCRQYLFRLLRGAATVINAPDYARTIQEYYKRRLLADLGNELSDAARGDVDVKDVATHALAELDGIMATFRHHRARCVPVRDGAKSVIDRLESGETKRAYPTGLADLDRMLGGYFPGELTVVAARPSMGKSMFAASTLIRAAKNVGVLFFSLEMTNDQLVERLLSDIVYNRDTPVPYQSIRNGDVTPNDLQRLTAAADRLSGLPIVMDDQAGLTISEIASRTRRIAQRMDRAGTPLGIVCVDHMGKARASDRYAGNKVNETGEIISGLAALAKDMDLAVIALSQLNRALESRDDKRPNLSDLRNSGDIEQDADTVMFLYRDAYYLERDHCDDNDDEADRLALLARRKNDLEIIIAKQRSGPTGTVRAFCDLGSNAVRDLA